MPASEADSLATLRVKAWLGDPIATEALQGRTCFEEVSSEAGSSSGSLHTLRVAAAAGVVAGAAGRPSEDLLSWAALNFRCVRMDRVGEEAFRGGRHGDASLYHLSEEAEFGDVDAFVTHSWDDPPSLKWRALQAWRADFKQRYGREPRVWMDRYCVDPASIADGLKVLPILLAACTKLVALVGATYHQRLWCLAELFTFLAVGGREHEVDLMVLPGAVSDWGSVDVRVAACDCPVDRRWLLNMMEAEKDPSKLAHAIGALFKGVRRIAAVAALDAPPEHLPGHLAAADETPFVPDCRRSRLLSRGFAASVAASAGPAQSIKMAL